MSLDRFLGAVDLDRRRPEAELSRRAKKLRKACVHRPALASSAARQRLREQAIGGATPDVATETHGGLKPGFLPSNRNEWDEYVRKVRTAQGLAPEVSAAVAGKIAAILLRRRYATASQRIRYEFQRRCEPSTTEVRSTTTPGSAARPRPRAPGEA